MLCAIFDELYNQGTLDYKHRAKISQFAENVYFGKPSGLLDQMASSTGGLAYIDFQNDDPQVKPMNYDFSKKGYSLVVVNTGGSHDDLTADYASIPAEMKAVARVFGQEVLRQVQPERFFLSLPWFGKSWMYPMWIGRFSALPTSLTKIVVFPIR